MHNSLSDQVESARCKEFDCESLIVPQLNVLLFIDDLGSPLAGTEQHLLFLLSQLPRPPLRICFAVFSGFNSGEQNSFPVTPVVLSRDALRGPLGMIQKLYRLSALIAKEQIDVVHTFCPLSELLAIAATRLTRRGQVLGVRRNTGYWHSRWSLWRTRLAAMFRVDLVANCEAAKQFSIDNEWMPSGQISVIRNPLCAKRRQDGIDRAVTRSSLGLDDVQHVVGIVANVRPVKDYATFLKAAQLVLQKYPTVHFVVVGAGEPKYLSQIRALATTLRLDAHLSWLGAVENPFSIIPVFDVALLSSRSEGFSNTLLEYAASGIPAVATDVGGTREIVIDGETGFVVPPAAPEALADRICHLLDDPQLRHSFGRRAKERAESTFAEQMAIRQYYKLYGRIASRAQAKPSASALTLVFHGVLGLNGEASALPDTAVNRYTVGLRMFQFLLTRIEPSNCCTASQLPEKVDRHWTILTFDDGLASDYTRAFPGLQERKLRATFFVTTSNVGRSGYTDARQLREMAAAGMEIASHGLNHRYLVTLSRHDAVAEIRDSKSRLEDLLGGRVTSFAPVGGHFARWMLDAAAEAGYSVFATMVPGQSRTKSGMMLLRRNHLQAHHTIYYAARLLSCDPNTLRANRFRYELLRLPKTVLGMRHYDRLKGIVLR